ncbi:MAG: glycoside hydrolase family 68 protein [Gammaproteobacteria bacterium]|nr:glycoside hydrolase family 68 protein [Gammaproteobacteria bacterium]
MTSHWRPDHLANLLASGRAELPQLEAGELQPVIDGHYLWDQCPVHDKRGDPVVHRGVELWLALSAPVSADPAERHIRARLRLLMRGSPDWIDCGNLLPDGFSQGSREWAGMLYLDDANGATLFFTAAGFAGERMPSYTQRIFEASGTLVTDALIPRFENWEDHGEPIRADGHLYELANEGEGEPGSIKAFRDPFYFRDPADGQEYLLFSASDAKAASEKNAAIGIAAADLSSGRWVLQEPLVVGDGVTNEMERAHIVFKSGNYYIFWSTHGWTIDPRLKGPTGLYGMVSNTFNGPYEALNGSGLVAANPASCPYQGYSWLVADDLSVSSFVDMLDGEIRSGPNDPHYPLGRFEGTFAPQFRLQLDGKNAWIAA